MWFDVIARLSFVLHEFILQEIEARKSKAYAENFCWLARRNLEYLRNKRYYLDPIAVWFGRAKGPPVPISLNDLERAVNALGPNPTIPE